MTSHEIFIEVATTAALILALIAVLWLGHEREMFEYEPPEPTCQDGTQKLCQCLEPGISPLLAFTATVLGARFRIVAACCECVCMCVYGVFLFSCV